jgi:hypothetical protein
VKLSLYFHLRYFFLLFLHFNVWNEAINTCCGNLQILFWFRFLISKFVIEYCAVSVASSDEIVLWRQKIFTFLGSCFRINKYKQWILLIHERSFLKSFLGPSNLTNGFPWNIFFEFLSHYKMRSIGNIFWWNSVMEVKILTFLGSCFGIIILFT